MAAVGETAEKISRLSIKDGSSNADFAASAPNLRKNLSILSAEQVRSIVNALVWFLCVSARDEKSENECLF